MIFGTRYSPAVPAAALALTLGWSVPSDATPAAEACRPAPPPSITVDAPIPAPTVITNLDRDQLAGIRQSDAAGASFLPERLDGLTSSRVVTRYQIAIEQTQRHPDCFRISRLDVDIDVAKLEVYIVSELGPASCRHRVTLDHEMQHVAVLEAGLAGFRKRLQAALEADHFVRPVRADSVEDAFHMLGDAAAETVEALRTDAMSEIERGNRELDTPASYAALNARCP